MFIVGVMLAYVIITYADTYRDRLRVLDRAEDCDIETRFAVLYEFERVSGHKHFIYLLIGAQEKLYNKRIRHLWH